MKPTRTYLVTEADLDAADTIASVRVGDTVQCLVNGQGTIASINPDNARPISVIFNGHVEYYTAAGFNTMCRPVPRPQRRYYQGQYICMRRHRDGRITTGWCVEDNGSTLRLEGYRNWLSRCSHAIVVVDFDQQECRP